MTTYNTNNPVPSADARDRFDNSQTLDEVINGTLTYYPNRIGANILSLRGTQQLFETDQAYRQEQFDIFIQGIRNASQYVDLGPYAAGLVFTSRNQVFSYNPGTGAEFYSPGPAITLPYTTTGAGAGEIATFRSVGDAILRSDLLSDQGGTHVGFKSPLAGAVSRNLYSKLQDVVSIKDFGAVGDFVPSTGAGTDCTAAFIAACAAGSGNRAIYVPPGKYRVNSTISTTNPVSFYGDSPESCRIYFYDCDGFEYNATGVDGSSQISFEGVALVTTAKGTRTAVKITRSSSTNTSLITNFKDVAFVGGDIYDDVPSHTWPGEVSSYALEWLVGVDGTQCDSFSAESVYVRGRSNAHTTGFPIATRGFLLRDTTYVYTKFLRLFFLEAGFYVTGQSEGVRFGGGDVVACNRGYVSMDTTSPSNHHIVSECHFSCVTSGVYIGPNTAGATPRSGQHVIHSNFFLKRQDGTIGAAGYTAVHADTDTTKAYSNVIQANLVGDYLANGDVGVYLGGSYCSASDNTGYNCGTLISVGASANSAILANNFVIATGAGTSTDYANAGANTVISGSGNAEDSTIGSYLIPSNIKVGRVGAVQARTISGLTSGNNISYDTQLEFTGGSGTVGQGEMRVRAGTLLSLAASNVVGGVLRPNGDNLYALGQSGNRWTQLYLATGTINTSDERQKQQIRELSDAERAVAVRLKALLRAFKFNDAVEAKGSGARIHFGVIAQDVVAAFASEGLDASNYAMLCHDKWEAVEEVLGDDGQIIEPARTAGDRYGVRYEELLAFLVSAL